MSVTTEKLELGIWNVVYDVNYDTVVCDFCTRYCLSVKHHKRGMVTAFKYFGSVPHI